MVLNIYFTCSIFHRPRTYGINAPYQRATLVDALKFAVKGLIVIGFRLDTTVRQVLALFAK